MQPLCRFREFAFACHSAGATTTIGYAKNTFAWLLAQELRHTIFNSSSDLQGFISANKGHVVSRQKVKPCVNSAQQEIRDWVTASFLWQIVYRKNWRQIPVKQSCTICVPSQRSCHAVNLTFEDPGPTSNLPKLSHMLECGVAASGVSYFTLSHWQLNAITRVVQCKTVHFSVCACHPCMGVSLDMFDNI